MSYWNNTGTYQKEYEILYSELVPSMDNADTLEGELLRAISSIYYDAYNNGFYNNKSGPFNFLMDNFRSNLSSDFSGVIGSVVNTGGYSDLDVMIKTILDDSVDKIVHYIMTRDSLTPNTKDMYDYSDADVYIEEDDETEDCDDYNYEKDDDL
jgi:hypothetical protein